ncbi:MAG TPA: hypothetical protein ENI39_07390 [Anaerolineae bacterium]|nr:hypothetical protein [Anaerolineae bacterium]
MPIAQDTRREIEAVLDEGFLLPNSYHSFLVKWVAFNRAYNDLDLRVNGDREKVLAVGERLQDHWGEVSDLARRLVSLECIGGERVEGSDLLKPTEWVKSATLYLRERFSLAPSTDQQACEFAACRPEKQRLCNGVKHDPWDKEEMAALLRLVYQVRCNLVHGDKRLSGQNTQTNRDRRLIEISTQVLDRVLELLLQVQVE